MLHATNYNAPGSDFILIKGGSFTMGSPESEDWRSNDETQHRVTVASFYMAKFEVTQKEWREITGKNPSNFTGDKLPVESITWLDAIEFCNALSKRDGCTPVYTITDSGNTVSWNRSANGYRLPTEAEWEYAARAGSTTPFYSRKVPGAEDVNFYGHYPYQIEQNYFNDEVLETRPGVYRGKTRGVAREIARQTGFDSIELELLKPYSTDYNTVLDQAQSDQHKQVRPALKTKIDSKKWEEYDIIILGYPNWWASIPMPIATLLESYDFSGKTIMPFCSHGGGRFGQSLTAISKLAPKATLTAGLSIHYSGGSSLSKDVEKWLKKCGVK